MESDEENSFAPSIQGRHRVPTKSHKKKAGQLWSIAGKNLLQQNEHKTNKCIRHQFELATVKQAQNMLRLCLLVAFAAHVSTKPLNQDEVVQETALTLSLLGTQQLEKAASMKAALVTSQPAEGPVARRGVDALLTKVQKAHGASEKAALINSQPTRSLFGSSRRRSSVPTSEPATSEPTTYEPTISSTFGLGSGSGSGMGAPTYPPTIGFDDASTEPTESPRVTKVQTLHVSSKKDTPAEVQSAADMQSDAHMLTDVVNQEITDDTTSTWDKQHNEKVIVAACGCVGHC